MIYTGRPFRQRPKLTRATIFAGLAGTRVIEPRRLANVVVEPGIAASAAAKSSALTCEPAQAPFVSHISLATKLSTAVVIASPAKSFGFTCREAMRACMASASIRAYSSKSTFLTGSNRGSELPSSRQ